MKKYIYLFCLICLTLVCSCEKRLPNNEIIPSTTEKEDEFLFSHTIFMSSTELYFYKSGNSFKVYSTEDKATTLNEIKISLPKDLIFDTATPISASNGAGSGECEFTVELEKNGELSYITFNNFRYTDVSDRLDFEYGGTIMQ